MLLNTPPVIEHRCLLIGKARSIQVCPSDLKKDENDSKSMFLGQDPIRDLKVGVTLK